MDYAPGLVGKFEFLFFTDGPFLNGDDRAGNCYIFNRNGLLKQTYPSERISFFVRRFTMGKIHDQRLKIFIVLVAACSLFLPF